MEVSDSVTSTLTKLLTNKVLAALKPAIAEEKEKLDERVHVIIQNSTVVCLIGKT